MKNSKSNSEFWEKDCQALQIHNFQSQILPETHREAASRYEDNSNGHGLEC